MRPYEVVFNEPRKELPVEPLRVVREVSELQELLAQRPVEPFVERVVGRRMLAAPPVVETETLNRILKVLVELRAVVVPRVPDLVVEEIREAVQEVRGVL